MTQQRIERFHQQEFRSPGDPGEPMTWAAMAGNPDDAPFPQKGDASAYVSEYDSIVSPKATQRVSFWDNFDGLQGDSGAGGTAFTGRYTIQNSGNTRAVFSRDTTTGHTRFLTVNDTVLASFSALLLVASPGQSTNSLRTRFRAAENPWFKCLVKQETAPAGGSQDYICGFRANGAAGAASGASDGIYFRAITGADWFLVCRTGGSETTLDMGVAPSTTLILLEFRVGLDGGQVEGYYNNRRVGVIRANIDTVLNVPIILHDNRAITVTTAGQLSCYGWGWSRDLIP